MQPVHYLLPFKGQRDVACPVSDADAVTITFLGTAGMLIQHRDEAIMSAPFYTNPNLAWVLLGLPIKPNKHRIDDLLPPVDHVRAILVGHAHYDHLMDAIYVAKKKAPKATLYGSDTMVHIVKNSGLRDDRFKSLEGVAGDWWTPGKWEPIDGTHIRIMAIRSEHAPHFLGVKLFGGEVNEDLPHPPYTAYGWKEGQTLAYLIDFMDGARVAFRIYEQDSASNPPYGFPPLGAAFDERPVDVAILCVASFKQVEQYPEAVVRFLAPKNVVLTHWDNFFEEPKCPPKCPPDVVPFTDTSEFAARLTSSLPPGARWHTPNPGATVRFCLR